MPGIWNGLKSWWSDTNLPWRDIRWNDKQIILRYVQDYKPPNEGQLIRILLHGPEATGKSSFINSVQSVLQGRMFAQALADNACGGSFTKKYTTYKIQKGPETFYPFVFNDIKGLSKEQSVLEDDIKLVLKGHVKEGYRFNPGSKLPENDLFYNNSPTDNDRVHLLAFVFTANACLRAPPETLEKIKDIREGASELGIPQVVILTKIDEFNSDIKKDLKNVYMVMSLKKQMEEFSKKVGIAMNCIFPVKNYFEEIDLNDDVDSLILSTLKNLINFGGDYLNVHEKPSGDQDQCT